MAKTFKTGKSATPISSPKKAKVACATKQCCSPTKVTVKQYTKKSHELDAQLQANAMQELARHYMKLARFKDGERLFKRVNKDAAQNSALDLLGAAFDLSDRELTALTASL